MDRRTNSPEPSLEAQPEPSFEAQPEPSLKPQPEPSLEAQPEPILKVQPDFGATKDQQICTITVRVIKSFEFRTIKHIVLRVDTARTTVGELKDICTNNIKSDAKFKAYRNVAYDTLKIYTHAFGHKTQNLSINLGEDGFLLDEKATLEFAGIRNETELSFFWNDAYKIFVKSPKILW